MRNLPTKLIVLSATIACSSSRVAFLILDHIPFGLVPLPLDQARVLSDLPPNATRGRAREIESRFQVWHVAPGFTGSRR